MKKERYILFTAGRGPIECQLAVKGIQKKFKQYLDGKKIDYSVVNQQKGNAQNSIESIVFKVSLNSAFDLSAWLGTIQWVCKSPIRKFSKRKNWFIKCEELQMSNSKELKVNEVVVQSYRASGPGGQHRNKVETAIRLIHKQSGIIVTASDGKSQAQNKKKAWQKLNEKMQDYNDQLLKNFKGDKWSEQITIERGNPIKIFVGQKFNGT